MKTKKCLTWSENGCSASEPVFVGKPESSGEDDGKLVKLSARSSSHCELCMTSEHPFFEYTIIIYIEQVIFGGQNVRGSAILRHFVGNIFSRLKVRVPSVAETFSKEFTQLCP